MTHQSRMRKNFITPVPHPGTQTSISPAYRLQGVPNLLHFDVCAGQVHHRVDADLRSDKQYEV